jgi:phospholipase/carboxylesterase
MQLQHSLTHIVTRGKPLEKAQKVMVMMHGRGATARDILSLTNAIDDDTIAFIAPQATQNTWYPYSFMAPLADNEPGLSSALSVLDTLLLQLHKEYGFAFEQIFLLGFSQGACLTLEYTARNPRRFGGIFGLSGGLIGPKGQLTVYGGDLGQTPVFLGCSDVDFHIPKERVLESEQIFKSMNASVLAKLYKNLPHTVNDDELNIVSRVIANATF